MRIIFMGTPDFSVGTLEALVEAGHEVCLVVSQPDKPKGRGKEMQPTPVKEAAIKHGIPVYQPKKIRDPECVEELRKYNADVMVVIAFGQIIPKEILEMTPYGCINVHASLLPKYRGVDPINWAVINGEKETGVTTFFLKHEIDTGDIIQQKKIDIAVTDNVGAIHDRLMELGAGMVIETVDDIINDSVTTIPQDALIGGGADTLPAPKIFKDTCHIDWNKGAESIYNLIRGLSPYPAAWSSFEKDGKEYSVKIFSTSLPMKCSDTEPGKVNVGKNRIFVDCADGKLEILSLQQSGKKRMDSDAFTRGFDLSGTYFK